MACALKMDELIGKDVDMQIPKGLYMGRIVGRDSQDNLLIKMNIGVEDLNNLQVGAIVSVFFDNGQMALHNFASRLEILYAETKEIGVKPLSEIVKIQRWRAFRFKMQVPIRIALITFNEMGRLQLPLIWHQGETVDLSATGTKVMTNSAIEVGDRARVELAFTEDDKVYATAEVLRKKVCNEVKWKYEMALKFVDLTENDSQTIVRFINSQLITEKRHTR